MLDKRGNRNSSERMDLLERFERVFPNIQMHCLSGDREFAGREWCRFLLVPDAMPFQLRLRHSDRISSRSGKQRRLSGKRWVWGRRVYIVATRLEDGELLILATAHRPQTALADYLLGGALKPCSQR